MKKICILELNDIGKEEETMNQNSMLRRNEKEANIIVAKVMRITFVIFTIVYHAIRSSAGLSFEVNYIWVAVCGIISGLLSIVGDLTASLVKRQNNIKDFGNLMPGHGGALDRFDSVLFVAPFMALTFEYIKFFN